MSQTAESITFAAKLCRPAEGGDWTFLRLPQEASDGLPSRSQVSVEGTIGGAAFVATLQPDGEGGHWLKVDPALGERANLSAGDTVGLEIAPTAVDQNPRCRTIFAPLSPSPLGPSRFGTTSRRSLDATGFSG